jgi:RNA polymerase sigma factor (sigma-70 family)
MERIESTSVIRQVESLFDSGSMAGMTDRQLLERFASQRDSAGEAAFAALVYRHGPMVLGLCRQLLRNIHDSEDAFQAVFLVLARRAASIGEPDLLANWLYGVALRTARKAKVRLARQRRIEGGDAMGRRAIATMTTMAADEALDPTTEPALDVDIANALHDEIAHLPPASLLPIVFCYFEGMTLDDAARRLHWPAGTLRSRLARARNKLRRGLTRRGIVMHVAVVTTAFTPGWASASVRGSLCDATAGAAVRFITGKAVSTSACATALAREVLRSMLLDRLRITALALLVVGAIATGAGFVSRAHAKKDEPKRPASAQLPEAAANQPDPSWHSAPGRMLVTGRVLDPQGKPVPNAHVTVSAMLMIADQAVPFGPFTYATNHQGLCDDDGRFRLETSLTSSSRHGNAVVTAMAPGYGIGWVKLDLDAEQPDAQINLRSEEIIRGRMFDIQGRPAQGVKVTVRIVSRRVNGRPKSTVFRRNDAEEYPAWPNPAISDAGGYFTLRGIGRELSIMLSVCDPRFAAWTGRVEADGAAVNPQIRALMPALKPDSGGEPRSFTIALAPAQTISGRVTYGDTGKPVPRAPIAVTAWSAGRRAGLATRFRADDHGQFRINPDPGDTFVLTAQSAEAAPYLAVTKSVNWPKGAVEQSVELALDRGIAIEGRVTEEGSGKPVAGAIARFTPSESDQTRGRTMNGTASATSADGSFHLAAIASRGYLVVQGPSDDYVLKELGASGGLSSAEPGSQRHYAGAYTFLDLKSASGSRKVDLALREGVTIKGRVVGPDDQPVKSALIFSRINLMTPAFGGWKRWGPGAPGRVRDGRFEQHGLDPDNEVPFYFLDSERELGTTVWLSGKSTAASPIAVRLDHCGSARARLVDRDGKVQGKSTSANVMLIITPGRLFNQFQLKKAGPLFADGATLDGVDPTHYPGPITSGADGRIALPALIPGATYRFIDQSTNRDQNGSQIRREFTVKPGETVDLGDILIEKPQGPD